MISGTTLKSSQDLLVVLILLEISNMEQETALSAIAIVRTPESKKVITNIMNAENRT